VFNTIPVRRYDMKSLVTFNPMFDRMVRVDPFEMLDSLFRDDSFSFDSRTPVVDVRETEKNYLIEAELPGITEKDLELSLKDSMLTLTAKHEEKKDEKSEDKYLLRERRSFSFTRTFTLPDDADADSVNAEFKNGVLTVDVAKKPERAPKTIEVKTA
jgi:HSP20 family protein